MPTDAVEQPHPVYLEKHQQEPLVYELLPKEEKMLLPDDVPQGCSTHSDLQQTASQSILSVPTFETAGEPTRGIEQNSIAPLADDVKMECADDLLHYEVELIDVDPMSSFKEEAETNTESSIVPKPDKIKERKSKPGRQKGKSPKYSESYLEDTVNKLRNGVISLNAASKLSGIPRATLQYRMSSVYKNKGSTGPSRVFSTKDEQEMVQSIKSMERKGFPITRSRIGCTVSHFLKYNPRKNPFIDNKPGKGWVISFVKRYPDVKPMLLPIENVTEADIRSWFRNIGNYLDDNQLADILKDPSRILKINEAGFRQHSVLKIVENVQNKNVSFIDTAFGHHNVTATFTFLADGSFLPPHVVLAAKRLSTDMKQAFPSDWGLGTTKNGWQDARNFSIYVMKVLYPALVARGTQFPVLCFVDGHKSDVPFETADWCNQHGIILIASYPNAMQICQQSEKDAFYLLKTTWTSTVKTWREENKCKRMTLPIFGSLLKEAMDKALNKSTIMDEFSNCGLYPFCSEAIDFSQYFANANPRSSNAIIWEEYNDLDPEDPSCSNGGIAYSSNITDEIEELPCDSVDTMDFEEEPKDRQIAVPESILKTALALLGPSKIKLYQTTPPEDLSQEDKILSYVYKNILILAEPHAKEVIHQPINKADRVSKPTALSPNHDTEILAFDIAKEMPAENNLGESIKCDKPTADVPEKEKQNKINSNRTIDTNSAAVCFAKKHICSFPRVTTHYCPTVNKTKPVSYLLDLTSMYIAYLDTCRTSSQEPVTGQVYNDILLKERTKDPPLSSRCADCQHVEKLDLEKLSYAFLTT